MPEVARFYGIVIKLFFGDHPPPHFHAIYGEYNATKNVEQSRFSQVTTSEVVYMQYPKIKSALAIDNHTLLVEFSNAEKRKYDIRKLLQNEIFFPLNNPGFFKNFKIDSTGCAIVWNEDIDISEYEIWCNGSHKI